MDEGLGPDVLGHEVSVLAEAITGALDLHDDGMVQKTIQQGSCDDGIPKNFAPFCKAAV